LTFSEQTNPIDIDYDRPELTIVPSYYRGTMMCRNLNAIHESIVTQTLDSTTFASPTSAEP
jgi:hypothetical protein